MLAESGYRLFFVQKLVSLIGRLIASWAPVRGTGQEIAGPIVPSTPFGDWPRVFRTSSAKSGQSNFSFRNLHQQGPTIGSTEHWSPRLLELFFAVLAHQIFLPWPKGEKN